MHISFSFFLFSYDLRGRNRDRPKHWTDEHVLGSRVHFKLGTKKAGERRRGGGGGQPQQEALSELTIRGVVGSDEGLYRCRVDFQQAPTRNSIANLTVIGKTLLIN